MLSSSQQRPRGLVGKYSDHQRSVVSGISTLELERPPLFAASDPPAQSPKGAPPDFSLHIAPLNLELAPGKIIETVGYNGTALGPMLRVKEGQRVTIEVCNDSDVPELVHWHRLMVPSEGDGTMEEGTPMVPVGARPRYSIRTLAS